ncbi:MAG: twin-arginine translocase subunit TatC [Luteolibacter sp.]
MFVLKKIFQLREKAHPDHEKPFLEHLEDLRVCVTRIVVTLLIAFIACFAFHQHLFKVMQRPIDRVWEIQVSQSLPTDDDEAPRPVDAETWESAKLIERAASALRESERAAFFESLGDEEMAFHVRMVALVRAVRELPEERRESFIATLALDEDAAKQLSALLKKSPDPNLDARGNIRMMSALKPTETFMLSMKLSFFAAIIVSFPLLLMFILQFVLPGLHSNEKRVLWPSMAVGFGLFLSGVLFAYYVVLPLALDFFQSWGENMGVSNDWRIGEYITFATQFTLLFGLSFELPVVVMALVKIGLLTYTTMSNTRSYAILAIFVAAAIITPTPDALTLSLMAGPMILLYEICIWLAWFDERKEKRRQEAEARERAERRAAYIASKPDGGDDDETDKDPDGGVNPPAPANDLETLYESGDSGWDEKTPIDPHDPEWQSEIPDDPNDPYWYHETDEYRRDMGLPPKDQDKPGGEDPKG